MAIVWAQAAGVSSWPMMLIGFLVGVVALFIGAAVMGLKAGREARKKVADRLQGFPESMQAELAAGTRRNWAFVLAFLVGILGGGLTLGSFWSREVRGVSIGMITALTVLVVYWGGMIANLVTRLGLGPVRLDLGRNIFQPEWGPRDSRDRGTGKVWRWFVFGIFAVNSAVQFSAGNPTMAILWMAFAGGMLGSLVGMDRILFRDRGITVGPSVVPWRKVTHWMMADDGRSVAMHRASLMSGWFILPIPDGRAAEVEAALRALIPDRERPAAVGAA